MGNSFMDRALAAEHVPSLPNVALEVLALSRKANATADELAAIVQNDPAITARLLQIVNSAMFGIPRRIGSVRQAIAMMGVRSVTVTVLTFALVEGIKTRERAGVDLRSYWKGALSSAVSARLLAQRVAKAVAEEAFVVGLLSDIGRMAAASASSEDYGAVCARAEKEGRPLDEVESEELGVDHAQISAALLRNWGLPDRISDAVEAHHGRDIRGREPGSAPIIAIARAAARISALFCGDVCPTQIGAVTEQCARELGIDASQLEAVLVAVGPGVREAANALSVEVGATVNFDELKSEAALRLAGLSIEAEAERARLAQQEEAARSDAERLRAENRAILEVASTDSLTKLHNRAAFDQALEKALEQARASRQPLAVCFIDVDFFKQFNDLHGHLAGDQALRTVAERLRAGVGAGGVLARYGGEEFVVILPGLSEDDARRLAENLRASVESADMLVDGKPQRVTISVGVAYSTGWAPSATPETLVRLADERLYRAKRAGRNRVDFGVIAPHAGSPRLEAAVPTAAA